MAAFLTNEINSTGGDITDRAAHAQVMFPIQDKKIQCIWRHFFWDEDE